MAEQVASRAVGARIPLMARVAKEIEKRNLSIKAAAKLIGVGVHSLNKHLRGEHVRSDSVLKYQDWLDGREGGPRALFSSPGSQDSTPTSSGVETRDLPEPPTRPRLVADLFSGCGGLSLGFDLLDKGRQFQTAIALDVEDAPIRVLNRNSSARANATVGRRVDLTDFMNEAEFLAFYVDHAARLFGDQDTTTRLNKLVGGAFSRFLDEVAAVDARFIRRLSEVRDAPGWQDGFKNLDREVLGQTSVAAFHARLRLPRTGTKQPLLPPLLWYTPEGPARDPSVVPDDQFRKDAAAEWVAEVQKLVSKKRASGSGQLDASARRVSSFVSFLTSSAFKPAQDAWVLWRASRLTLRDRLFTNEAFARGLRALYVNRYPVSVLVGGPPCQGFSRIGRGKIRSLRDSLVHAHSSDEAGDSRNLLFLQYVMILGALKPDLFLFENVQHFQSKVSAEGGDFEATEVLEEAIANVSEGKASYTVSSAVLNAARHGVPQNRLRYFMCGVRSDGVGDEVGRKLAALCLTLPEQPEAPLRVALEGLPAPLSIGGDRNSRDAMRAMVRVSADRSSASSHNLLVEWLRQPPIGKSRPPRMVDCHAVRASRSDDEAFFSLLGPGRRWMDYRADDAPTISALAQLLAALRHLPPGLYETISREVARSGGAMPDFESLEDLRRRIDGSLPLRLLLEQITKSLGYSHHLMKESYLAKRDGSHGDWLMRMDAEKPSKTMVSHMSKDTYGFVHPFAPRTISVREAARIQTFPDRFSFADVSLTDAFRMIGNAVPPLLSHWLAANAAAIIHQLEAARSVETSVLPQVSAA